MVGAFVATTLGVSQTVSADLDQNILGSNMADAFKNKVVRIESVMDVGRALDWDQCNLDQVMMYNNTGSRHQKWNMFYDSNVDTYTISTKSKKNEKRHKTVYLVLCLFILCDTHIYDLI